MFFRPEKVGISKCPLNIVGVPVVVRPTGVEGEGERWRSVRPPSRCSSRLYFDLREEGKEDEMKNDIRSLQMEPGFLNSLDLSLVSIW